MNTYVTETAIKELRERRKLRWRRRRGTMTSPSALKMWKMSSLSPSAIP